MAQPSPVPVRYPSGVSTDFPWGPLAAYGRANPFGYHTWYDDFDILSPALTATKTGAGTVASQAGDGGALLFTTAALATDNAVLSLPAATFKLTPGKKAFFLCRLQVSSALNAGFMVGLLAATTTPFTGTPADGLWIGKASGVATMTFNSAIGSVVTTTPIPASPGTVADNVNIDLGFAVDRNGSVAVFVGPQLIGWLPQSGVGGAYGGRGPVVNTVAATLTAVNLMPVVAVLSGSATAKTMALDFALAAVER